MTKLLAICVLLASTYSSSAGEIPVGAISYFAAKYGHEHPDTIQIVKVDFQGNGSRQFLMTFAKNDWEGPFASWGVVELKNGQWTEPKTLDTDGEIKELSAVSFNPVNSGFIYLPAYKKHGLITQLKRSKGWIFTYLFDDILYNVHFWTASQAGMTDDQLKSLMDAHKLVIHQEPVQ